MVKGGWTAPVDLRAVVVGGGRLEETAGRAARELGWPVLASYGLTEAGSQVATQSPELLDAPYAVDGLPVLSHWELGIGTDERIVLRKQFSRSQLIRYFEIRGDEALDVGHASD